ncbi:unnamed protein product [Tenebrio molitor]|nr:unnamed protein product [Tenebrio molitor]
MKSTVLIEFNDTAQVCLHFALVNKSQPCFENALFREVSTLYYHIS